MKELLQALLSGRFEATPRSLSLGVVYQDSETHQQATGVYEFLLGELDEAACVTATWWRTSLLSDPRLSGAAGRAVGRSELILVSVQDSTEPSLLLRSWVELWPIDLTRPPGLIALLNGCGDKSRSAWEFYLQGVAHRWAMPYLSGSLASITQTTAKISPVEFIRTERVVEPYLHWGLNE